MIVRRVTELRKSSSLISLISQSFAPITHLQYYSFRFSNSNSRSRSRSIDQLRPISPLNIVLNPRSLHLNPQILQKDHTPISSTPIPELQNISIHLPIILPVILRRKRIMFLLGLSSKLAFTPVTRLHISTCSSHVNRSPNASRLLPDETTVSALAKVPASLGTRSGIGWLPVPGVTRCAADCPGGGFEEGRGDGTALVAIVSAYIFGRRRRKLA
ncbi:hypothetical protein BGZ57DRAFT_467956 [Hyaloscypha finlandica]|nr:hypothetical protein BGZ57DRAFT_467956 [Hyaloscypha finlandica]